MRPSIPPATVTSSPVTWPESSSEGEHDDVARDVLGSTPTWIAEFAAAWHTSIVPSASRAREQNIDLDLVGEVGLERDGAADVLRAARAPVIVDGDGRSLGANARAA